MAPLLIGTGIEAALGTGFGGISTSVHFYYKLSQELNEDMEQVWNLLFQSKDKLTH